MNYFHVVEKTMTSLHQEETASKYNNRDERRKSKQIRSTMTIEEIILKDMEKQLNLFNTTYNKSSSHNIMANEKKSKMEKNNNKHDDYSNKESHLNDVHDNDLNVINKKTKYIYTLHIELLILFLLGLIILTTILVFFSANDTINIRENSGKWRYTCPLEGFNLLLNGIEMAYIILLVLKVLKIWNYVYVFKHIKYLGYSLLIWVTLGPLIDVNLYNFICLYNIFKILII